MVTRFILWIGMACTAYGAGSFSLVGVAVNTTDPDKTLAASVQMDFGPDDTCVLTISAPLIGSGSCAMRTYDEKSGRIEITSIGAASITWTGTVKGNLVTGSYRVDPSQQSGTFYLAIIDQPAKAPAPQPQPYPLAKSGSQCVPAIESAIAGAVHGWDGETIFKLDNGQIWQQAEYDYTYFYEYHPDVTIYQTTAGCRMKVKDEEDTIVVKRIK